MLFNTSSKRWYNWYISMVAAACMVLYGYDASVFNACQNSKHWVAYFGKPDTYTLGLVNSSYNIGGIVSGFFFGGPIADRLGRRWGMGIGCFLTVIATFVQCFAPNLRAFIGGRVIIGLGQGIALTAGPVYIGELAPPEIRGKIMGFWQLFYSVGSFIAYWIAFATGKHTASLGEWDWKLIVIFQMLVPIIIMVLLPFIPETPRWYIQNGNNVEKARRSLLLVRDTEQEVEDELLQIREAIEYEKESKSTGSYKALWMDASVRKRLLIAFIINGGQQITGQGSLNSYSSAIYKGIYKDASTINLINAINGTCGILFTLNAVWTVDRYGRKFLFIVGGLGMALCMICFAAVGVATPDRYYKSGGKEVLTKDQPVGIALTFLLFLFIFFYKPTWGATTWIWTAEIFSMNVRAQAVGMCSQFQNVTNLIFNQFFPTFLANCSFYTFFFFAGINVLLALFVVFIVPETRNIMLEEMDVLFGGVNHVEKGGAQMGVEDAHHAHVEDRGLEMNDDINQAVNTVHVTPKE
ncbi:sugar transporter protein [Rutstroemia sp. NJR-2017a WRK4]|nr:sugar transporter protein [Rutstroemia sp. NJR-2017a WRK4]